MGGNIFQLKSPEYPDFGEEERKWEALRIAQQQRKLQAAQSLMQMAKFHREEQDWKREDAYRNALSNIGTGLVDPQSGLLHPKAADTLMKIDPSRTFSLSEALSKSATEKAKAAAAKEATDLGHRKLAFYDLSSSLNIPDDQKRLEYAMNMLDRLEKVGAINQDELESMASKGVTPEFIDRVGTRILGPEEYGKIQQTALNLQKTRREEDAAKITQPAEIQEKLLKADEATRKKAAITLYQSTNQEEWDKALKSLPVEIQPLFPKEFTPTNKLKALALGQTPAEIAAQVQREMPNNAKELMIWMNQPERTAEEKAIGAKSLEQMQAYDVAVAEASAGAKPMSAEASKVHAIATTMVPELQQLKAAIKAGGRRALFGIISKTDPHLSRLADNVADKVGRIRSGGAVNPSEEARFMGQLARLADLWSGSTGPAEEAIDGLIEEAQRVSGGMEPGGNRPSTAPTSTPTQPARKVPLQEVMPGGVPQVGQIVNGKRVTKVTKVQ